MTTTSGRTYRFASGFRVGRALPDFDQATVKAEPMLFSADLRFAREVGGPITQAFLDAIGPGIEDAIVDTRVHMLMPGWFPCIPGWHHDDIPRSRPDGQPNYETPEYRAKHVLALVNGDIAPTEFAVGTFELPHVPEGQGPVYKHWNETVSLEIAAGFAMAEEVPSNRLVFFDDQSFHQGTAAKRDGWRWFGRVSWDTGRRPTNEIRQQVQAYMPCPFDGW